MNYEDLERKYAQIPQEIKNIKRWVCYKTEIRDGKETKVPMNALTGGYAKSNDPLTWTSYKLALSGCVKYNFIGLGFMLGKDTKTGVTYFGIDLDNHIDNVTGEKPYPNQEDFEEFASEFINTLNSYTEYSHSGEGIHIICKGTLPEGARKRKAVEMYDWGRFFTMTGNVINNVPIEDRTEEVKPLWEKYLNVENEYQNSANYEKTPQIQAIVNENGGVSFIETETIEVSPTNISDNELVEKIRNSQQGHDFMRLFNGDMTDYGNDHSRADMALCKILAFWTGCDANQIDRIFRQSGLMREKWNRRQSGTTYGAITIESAIKTQRDVYVPPKEKITIQIKNNDTSLVKPQGDIVEFDERNDPVINIKQIFKTYPLTDTGNAERFYDYFGENFRYNSTNKCFLYWNGKTWTGDMKNYVKKYADKIIDVLRAEIAQTEEKIKDLGKDTDDETDHTAAIKVYQDLRKGQIDNLKRVSNKAGKEAMLSEFQHLHEIPIQNEELDTYPNYLNTESGVVNLDDGKIMPFDKKLMLSKNTNVMVSYEEPKVFLKFLHDIFKRPREEETEEIINTVQMLLGESLTGRTNKDRLVILYGNGSNGKSTFIKTIRKCFGEYGKTINSELLLQQKSSSAQSTEFAYAALVGARMLSMSETNENEKMNDKIIKQLTSGEEIPAQFKFGNSFSYDPTFSPWMSTNNLPVIRSKDYGIWRRIYLIPFVVTFTDENKDIHMPEKLAAEMPQILGWMIKGNIKLNNEYKGIVPKPKCLEEALSDYKGEMDVVNVYIASHCQNFPGYKTSAIRLFQDYKKWALDNNEYAMPESKFKADMVKHGFACIKDVNEGWVYVGIKLNSDQKGHIFGEDD